MAFIAGSEVARFVTKSGKTAIISYPSLHDLDSLLSFVNTISTEDTYLTFSGEQLSKEEEADYLHDVINASKRGDFVKLFCSIDSLLVGIVDVRRELAQRTRGRHIGIFGLMVSKDFRHEGIGEQISLCAIATAVINMPGLRMIRLQCMAENTKALRLYEKLGFIEYGRLPKGTLYRGEYIDEVLMYLPL